MTSTTVDGYEFDQAIAVQARADGTTFDAVVDAGFTVGGKANGGYLLALAANAAGRALAAAGSAHRDPLASTVHFLAAPDAGPATVTVDVLRQGRSASQVRATVAQGDRRCVDATFTLGTLPDEPEAAWWTGIEPPPVAPYDDCPRLPARREGAPFEVAIMDRSDLRLDPATTRWATHGTPSGHGVLRGWISFGDGRPADPLGLLFFLDALPPATFDLVTSGWVPTLSLTAYLRSRPAPGPLRITQRAQVVGDGRVDEVCEIWDSADRLVGQATQLAAIRFEPGTVAPERR